MEREEYILLSSDLHIQKVLLELGLLSVKQVVGDEIFLGSPNWTLTEKAMRVFVHKTHHEATPADLADEYLSRNGFATTVTNRFRGTGQENVHEYSFQGCIFMQLFYHFPIGDQTVRLSCYNLYKEVITCVIRERSLYLCHSIRFLHSSPSGSRLSSIKRSKCASWYGHSIALRRGPKEGIYYRGQCVQSFNI
jgi:hypothetical protein